MPIIWGPNPIYDFLDTSNFSILNLSFPHRTVIKTTDAERQCVEPKGLQDEINKIGICIIQ